MATLQESPEEQAVAEGKKAFGAKKKIKKKGESSDLYKIVKLVMDRSLDPAIVFSFAKKCVLGPGPLGNETTRCCRRVDCAASLP